MFDGFQDGESDPRSSATCSGGFAFRFEWFEVLPEGPLFPDGSVTASSTDMDPRLMPVGFGSPRFMDASAACFRALP